MADEIIGATIKVLLEKAISLATDRIGLVLGFNKDLEELRESADTIQAILADAETKQTESRAVQLWLEKVEKVAVDADNVLDELSYESLRREVKSRNQSRGKMVCFFFSLSKHDISFRWKMGSKVRDINAKLKIFNIEATNIGLMRLTASLIPTTAADTEVTISRETNSLAPQFVAGRAKEESEIVQMLLASSDQNVFVLPIVGMGGLGKTTLAKSVYNNQQIHSYFTKKIWICVSEKFEVTELFRLILESLRGGKGERMSQDAIVGEIRQELHGKRFLLVLDDVWNENPELWDDFLVSLVGLSTTSGSCCLLTTRLLTTANLVVANRDPYFLGKLSDDDCWSILANKATLGGEMPEELNVHRKQILRKCQGLPLAANVIGGLLLRLQKMEDWLSIVENKILKLGGEHTDGIMQVLKLSFDYLPSSSIKKCFAYCSIFPKDKILKGDELIELWMAEGFLEGNDVERGTMMEEIGGKYLRILLQSSLLVIHADFGEPYYQMHDLVHDLATNVSKRKRPNGESGLSNDGQSPYLALDSFGEGTGKVLNAMSPLIRTLFLTDTNTNISFEMILKFKNLHVLNLFGNEIVKELPNSISILKHLRYLNLSCSTIRRLPESLCKLYHLQTLRLDFCSDLQGLPQGMNNLISLRHLHCNNDSKLQMPVEMGRLTCLQTLGFFNIGGEKGRGIEELGRMEKLKGDLEIRNLELVKGKEEAQQADLFGKQNLTGLRFGWTSRDRHGIDIDCDEQVLEGLQPQTNLKWLTIENYMGDRFPQWLGNLTCLGYLNLENCKSCKELPALGHLPCLETLHLEGLEKVGCIGTSFYNGIEEDGGRVVVSRRRKLFPALKRLTLIGMSNLVEWKEVEGVDDGGDNAVFPKLENLFITDCSRLTITPTQFPSLKEVVISRNVQVMTVKAILSKTFGALKCLRIWSMDDMTCLSQVVEVQHNNNRPKSLEVLEITQCDRLTNIPSETLHYCKILKEVSVKNCPNLESFPLDLQQTPSISSISLLHCPKLFTTNAMPRGFGHLINLRRLSIGPYSDDFIQLFDWPGLLCCSSTLQELQLHGYDQMQTQLPDQFHHFTSLRRLTLKGYEALEVLPDWLGNLGSLEEISLEDCQKLQHLPSIAAMGHLTKLRTLRLRNCPLLKEKCNSKSNPDSEWSKISRLLNNQIQVHYW